MVVTLRVLMLLWRIRHKGTNYAPVVKKSVNTLLLFRLVEPNLCLAVTSFLIVTVEWLVLVVKVGYCLLSCSQKTSSLELPWGLLKVRLSIVVIVPVLVFRWAITASAMVPTPVSFQESFVSVRYPATPLHWWNLKTRRFAFVVTLPTIFHECSH